LHIPEQQLAPASATVQASPDPRQVVLESRAHDPLSHDPPQHSASEPHAAPATLQTGPPHVLPLHASEQQSRAVSQCDPSGRQ
jgi:hypothetical protein